jgi:hypothetical protein
MAVRLLIVTADRDTGGGGPMQCSSPERSGVEPEPSNCCWSTPASPSHQPRPHVSTPASQMSSHVTRHHRDLPENPSLRSYGDRNHMSRVKVEVRQDYGRYTPPVSPEAISAKIEAIRDTTSFVLPHFICPVAWPVHESIVMCRRPWIRYTKRLSPVRAALALHESNEQQSCTTLTGE